MKILLILPTQLFYQKKNYFDQYEKVILIKDRYYINDKIHHIKYNMHVKSCDNYFNSIIHKNKSMVDEVSINTRNNEYYMYHPTDLKMYNKYKECIYLDTPAFLLKIDELEEYYSNRQDIFYRNMRKKFNLLMKDNKPFGNKWSYDNENRHKYPDNYEEDENKDDMFPPISRSEALILLKNFIKFKLSSFGFFQDAIKQNVLIGFHSYLSAPLNIGLITPNDVIKEIMKYDIPLNSLEGFIRQLVGWREYIRMHYIINGDQNFEYLNSNDTTVPKSWYTGKSSGIDILDWSILRVIKYGYVPHIERLMLLNNLAILSEFQYKSIKKWFINMFIDGYDWVMLNVSMNINYINPDKDKRFMTRVYLTNGNYLKKMGLKITNDDMKKIDFLYKEFIKKNKKLLKSDYRMASYISRINQN